VTKAENINGKNPRKPGSGKRVGEYSQNAKGEIFGGFFFFHWSSFPFLLNVAGQYVFSSQSVKHYQYV
jgi:hypothetical protein